MATRTCPQCGAQYVATVRRCIDCDVVLVDQARPEATGDDGSTASPLGAGDQVGYELEGWGNQLKVTLEGMLEKAGIGRVWEAGALVVSATDEAAIDDLIATLEGDDLPDLDDHVARVALEIEGLDADGRALLDAHLIAGSIAHAWDDEAALVVAEADEQQVLEIVGHVLDESDADDGDGLAAPEALSALYVAVDRLIKDPEDAKLSSAYLSAAAGLGDLAVPYGFSGEDWDGLVADADALAERVRPDANGAEAEPDEDDEDDVADDATDEAPAEDARTAAQALRRRLAELV